MAGVASIDGPSRRPMAEADSRFGGPLDGLAQGRQVQAVFEHVEHDPEAMFARLAKGDELPPGIDASAAAALTFRIAQRFRHSGRWDLADKTLALLTERYPDEPLARWALVWRLQSLPASEWRRAPRMPPCRPSSDANRKRGGDWPSPQRSHAGSPEGRARIASAAEIACRAGPASWPARSRSIGPICLLRRRFGIRWRPSIGNWGRTRRPSGSMPSITAASIATPGGTVPAAKCGYWIARARRPSRWRLASPSAERPHLDGRLDEALWKKCSPIVLSSPLGDDRAWPATVMLAHDEQYLYLAIQCRQAPGAHYEATSERRPRDPDLSQHDRVDIFLDLDRDYATYYHLTIDHRGWAADAICGDRSWNPKWFIAAQTSDGTWTAEAAIPLAELRSTIVPGKTIWALGLQRTVPGVGFQSWTTPAGVTVAPEGFGWLGFEK